MFQQTIAIGDWNKQVTTEHITPTWSLKSRPTQVKKLVYDFIDN